MLEPAPESAKFADTNYHIWCGSMTKGQDGKYHLFYSRWPRGLGFQAWVTHSEVAHAVADHALGPYKHVDVALLARGTNYWDGSCTHNPTILKTGKKYVLYYTGNRGDSVPMKPLNWTHRNAQRIGVALADSPSGPWKRLDHPVIDIGKAGAPDALVTANPAACLRPDGSILMLYKAVGTKGKLPFGGPVTHLTAVASQPEGPFKKNPGLVFTAPGLDFPAEDPFIWWTGKGYAAIVKDMKGAFTGQGTSLAFFESPNGFDWEPGSQPFVTTPEIQWSNGTREKLLRLERPQIWLKDGQPAILFCAAMDAAGNTFNVGIPLVNGAQL